jgi:Na+/H+ antiporter NhaC
MDLARSDDWGELFRYMFWAIPVIALLAIVIRLALHGSRTKQSEKWATAEATIFSANIQESGAIGGYLYAAEFVYSYCLGGEYLTGKAAIPVSQSEQEAQALVDRFPSGTRVKVRYVPEDPSTTFFRIEDQS